MSRKRYFCRENQVMATRSPSEVAAILAKNPRGSSLVELHSILGAAVSTRTLQRWLAGIPKTLFARIRRDCILVRVRNGLPLTGVWRSSVL